ncbi:hypothetical protein JOH52_000836 [Sinorhizobium meliloti]|uniref:hypothetical protein n=1 Tax=Rhizobium meliloti TaxID=382 RepID=UPI0010572835|nr:hypothetical protein [Sinorhizobium meliloti]MBP2464815.1 hypothetical protein [Sinorhizobium meliloti]MQW83434.1 hypothetical protein [Sinorhizobium meliloti]GEC36460.1 hypothetical protein EME01_05320 [Sinorhizobium meliloti]
MRDELYRSLFRYEAMTGQCDWENEDDPGREDRDRASYDKEYGLLLQPDGQRYTSYARTLRFLVEVCGHAYDESLESLVEHIQGMPAGGYRTDLDADKEARQMRAGGDNIIESLFHLKVGRLIAGDDVRALDYNWSVTRKLMALPGLPRLPYPNSVPAD